MRTYEELINDGFYGKIPLATLQTLIDYVDDGMPLGGFLNAVLLNDLQGAFALSDDENQRAMNEIVKFVYNEMPAPSHGSQERVEKWMEMRNGS